jgi:tellurite resistance protein
VTRPHRARLFFDGDAAELRARMRAEIEAGARDLRESGDVRVSVSDTAEVGRAAGALDREIARRIKALGFDGETARVFDLLPLVHVAWADGKIQSGERARIAEVLEARGIGPGDTPWLLVETLLEQRPSDDYMRESLTLLRAVLYGRASAETLVGLCIEVAQASGGFLGIFGGRITAAERETIDHIAEALGADAIASVRRRLGG